MASTVVSVFIDPSDRIVVDADFATVSIRNAHALSGGDSWRMGFGPSANVEAQAAIVDDLVEALVGLRAQLIRKAASPTSILDLEPFGRVEEERREITPAEQSPTYRSDMRDAGRGEQLR